MYVHIKTFGMKAINSIIFYNRIEMLYVIYNDSNF